MTFLRFALDNSLLFVHSVQWDYAMSVNVSEIVYMHCHQQDSGGTIVLVGQDGVQVNKFQITNK